MAFKLFGFEFPISPVLSPSVWLVLLVGMLGYVTIARQGIFRSMSRALRIERERLGISARERLASAPWWLDPLPISGPKEDPWGADLDLAIGWRPRPRWCSVSALLGGFVLVASVWFVLQANQDLLHDYKDPYLKQQQPILRIKDWQIRVAETAPALLVAIGVALVAFWRRPFPMANSFAGEAMPPDRCRWINRRRFINVVLATGTGMIALLCSRWALLLPDADAPTKSRNVPRDRSRLVAKLDRIRRRRNMPVAGVEPSAAYLNSNPDAPRIHFSTPKSSFRYPKMPKRHSRTEVPFAMFQGEFTKGGKRIALPEAGWTLELKAIEEANAKRFSEACDILLCAVRHDLVFAKLAGKKPGFRLYDLLAGLSVRGNTDHLDTLQTLLAASPMLPAFRDRMKIWNDKNARWRKRWTWTGKRKVWEVSVADEKDKNAQKRVLRLSMNT